jgi:Protein of unknown function (DUF1569)
VHPHLQRCREALRKGLAGLSPADADAGFGEKWSVARIVEHLDLTYTKNAAGLARRLEKGPRAARGRSLRQRIAQTIVVRMGYFPAGREAPAAVVPQGRPFVEVMATLDEHLVDLDARLSEAERVFGSSQSVLDHPVLGPFTVGQWRKFHWVHTRHHLRQIEARASQRL